LEAAVVSALFAASAAVCTLRPSGFRKEGCRNFKSKTRTQYLRLVLKAMIQQKKMRKAKSASAAEKAVLSS